MSDACVDVPLQILTIKEYSTHFEFYTLIGDGTDVSQ